VPSPADSDNRDGSSDADLFDAAGRLVVEPFVDAHVHLDYSNTVGRPRPNESGTLFEAIEIWAERKEKGLNDFDEIYRNALAAARSEAANGTGFIRSHVDVTDPELTALKAILQLREDVKDWIEIQIVAFPQNTVLSFRDGPQLLEQALEMGADVIGGIPHNEGTPEDGVASLRIIFDLAEKYGVPIDVHCDEIDDEQSRFVEVMAAFASKRRLDVPVTASHAVAMAYYNNSYMAKLTSKLIAAELNFAICPNENLQLQGWGMVPMPRGVAPIKRLVESGLNVAFGQDSSPIPFTPWATAICCASSTLVCTSAICCRTRISVRRSNSSPVMARRIWASPIVTASRRVNPPTASSSTAQLTGKLCSARRTCSAPYTTARPSSPGNQPPT